MNMINQYSRALARAIKKLRQERGLTQEQLGLEIDISTSYIGMIERSERNISLKNIYEISKIFNMPPSELLKLAEEDIENAR